MSDQEEKQRHTKDWDYVRCADVLRTRPLLLVKADDRIGTRRASCG